MNLYEFAGECYRESLKTDVYRIAGTSLELVDTKRFAELKNLDPEGLEGYDPETRYIVDNGQGGIPVSSHEELYMLMYLRGRGGDMDYTVFIDNTKKGMYVFEEHFMASSDKEAIEKMDEIIEASGRKEASYTLVRGNRGYGEDILEEDFIAEK